MSSPANTPNLGAVPTGSQQAQGGTTAEELLKSLFQERANIGAGINSAAQQAMIPMAGSSSLPTAGLTLPQVQPFQPKAMNNQPVVGAHNAKMRGIQNTITAAANLVGEYSEKKAKENQRVLAIDIERVMQSMDGVNQAQQVLKQDPNNQDAKAALQKNQGIIDAMLSDPKKRKQISKAMDISFTDPALNNKPEHAAFQQAIKSYSQQLQDKMPQAMVPNQQAQAKVATLQMQQKAIDDSIKQIMPLYVAETKAKEAEQLELQKEQAAMTRLQTTNAAAYQRAIDVAKLNGKNQLAVQSLRDSNAMNRGVKLLTMRENFMRQNKLTPDNQIKILQGNAKIYESMLKNTPDTLNKFKQERDNLMKSNPESPQIQKLNEAIHSLEDSSQIISTQMQSTVDKIKALSGGSNGNTNGSSGNSNTGSKLAGYKTVGEEDGADDEELEAIINE